MHIPRYGAYTFFFPSSLWSIPSSAEARPCSRSHSGVIPSGAGDCIWGLNQDWLYTRQTL